MSSPYGRVEPPTHGCPGGCGTQVPYRQLACKRCWSRLPRTIRDAVNESYRHRANDPTSHRRALQEARHWYRDNPIGATSA